jgi:hypothetical protein
MEARPEIEGIALNSHVAVYHHGRSDIVEVVASQHEATTTTITSIFKKQHEAPELPPIPSTSSLGSSSLYETDRSGELHALPLEQHVTAYNIGHYDQLQLPIVEGPTATAEHEELPEATNKKKKKKGGSKQMEKRTQQKQTVFKQSELMEEYPPLQQTTTKTTRIVEYPVTKDDNMEHMHETVRKDELMGTPLDAYVVAAADQPHHDHEQQMPIEAVPAADEAAAITATTITSSSRSRTTTKEATAPPAYPPMSDEFYQEGPMMVEVEQLPAPASEEMERTPLDDLVTPHHRGIYEEMPKQQGSEMPEAKPTMAEIGKQSELPAGEPIGIYSTTGRPADEPQAQPIVGIGIKPGYDADTVAAEMSEPEEILSRVELQKGAIELSGVEEMKGKRGG